MFFSDALSSVKRLDLYFRLHSIVGYELNARIDISILFELRVENLNVTCSSLNSCATVFIEMEKLFFFILKIKELVGFH